VTNPLRIIIRRFDGWLSRVEGVRSFTDDPRVIVRIQPAQVPHELILPEGVIQQRAPVLMLHLDNVRTPSIPAGGADLRYGLTIHRLLSHSWRAVAREVEADPVLHDIQALGGVSALFLLGTDGGASMMRGYGFTQLAYDRPGGAFGEFWENFYSWWLMWTYNPESVRRRRVVDLQRTEFWIGTRKFLEKYSS